MKIFRVATLFGVLGVSSFANAFVVPGSRVMQPTPLHLMTGGNRMRGNGPADYRMDEYYGEEGYRNRREAGYSISPNHHGEQFERYDPMRHTKEGKTYNERRHDFANRRDNNRYNNGNDYMMEDRGEYDNRRAQRPHERGHASRADGRPIVESARGGGRRLERYDPRAHRMNGESRFEPEKMPPTYEQTMRDRPSSGPGAAAAYQREGSYNWDQPFDERRGNGRRGGRVNNMEGVYRSRNNRSYSSGNSGRVITNDNRDRIGGMPPPPGPPPPARGDDGYGMRGNDDRYGMRGRNQRGMNNPRAAGGWRNENPNFRDRQETRSTAELLKNGGNDMFEDSRRGGSTDRRGRRGSNREQFRDRDNGGSYDRREDYYQGQQEGRGGDRYGDSYGRGAPRPGSAWEREAQTGGRRWEDPYRPGDRTMATRESLNGPQRLDGGTRRQWTFDADVGSVQLEMWTEGLPLMATVEIFEKGGQRKNSFDVYVEDGYSRPYSTVLDLPRQSGGTILIRNDGPVEYPIVANVQPFGSPRDAGYEDRAEEGW